MVTIEIVINSIHVMGVRVTIFCRYYIAFEVMLSVPSYYYYYYYHHHHHHHVRGRDDCCCC